jgi:thioredoxin reductase
VLLLDSGEYRNDAAQHMHNFVTQDGTPPAEFRAAAREQLKAYDTVELRDARVSDVKSDGDAWSLEADGEPVAKALKLILATGLRDTLPDKPGLQGLWGDVVAHCPYCHGHEFSGRHVAVLGAGAKVPMLASMMVRIASRVTVLTDGEELEEAARQQLKNLGVAVRHEPVTGTCGSGRSAGTGDAALGLREG